MTLTTRRLRLTSAEIAYLAALAEAPVVVGVPDPFAGALPEEISGQLDAARAALLERQVIEASASGPPTASLAWAEMLAPVFAPEAVAVIHRWTAAHGSSTGVLYLTQGRAVEQSVEEGAVALVELEPDQAADRAVGLIGLVGLLDLPEERPGAGSPGTLPIQALHRAAALARQSGPDQALAVLAAQGLAPETAAPLAETLARPQSSWTVRLYRAAGAGWEARSVGLAHGPGGLFSLRESDSGTVTVDPQPQGAVVEMLEGFVAEALAAHR